MEQNILHELSSLCEMPENCNIIVVYKVALSCILNSMTCVFSYLDIFINFCSIPSYLPSYLHPQKKIIPLFECFVQSAERYRAFLLHLRDTLRAIKLSQLVKPWASKHHFKSVSS